MTDTVDLSALRAETRRALNIIDTTQLSLFTTSPPIPLPQLEASIDRLLEPFDENSDPDAASAVAREFLRETLARFRDPYANYIDPRGHDAYAQRRRGNLVGVGLKFRARLDDYPLVLGVLQGGPLDGADLHPGDQLIAVDGDDLHGLGSSETRDRLAGVEGSMTRLVVRRRRGEDDDEPTNIAVTRRTVALHYARSDRLADGRIAYIKISRFGTDTHERVSGFVDALESDDVEGIVLDLRDNPGGSTRAARAVTSMFDELPDIYCETRREGRMLRLPREGEVVTRRPLVVLVNERSMSSAEIVAGALQLADRARIIGAPTWGKGLIQKVYPLQKPLGGAVRTTIATFATSDGIPLHARGIVPDIYVPSAPHGLYEEVGSLNVSADSRAFRRELILDRLAAELSTESAKAFAALPDIQLDVAITGLTA